MRSPAGTFAVVTLVVLSLVAALQVPVALAGVYPATDVPKVIPALEQQAPGLPPPGPNWVTSTVTVPDGRPAVGEVRIHNLRVAHGDSGNLRFELISPAGTAVTLFEQVSSREAWTFDNTGFGLADRALEEFPGVSSMDDPPMQDTYRPRFSSSDPTRQLARFAGESASGDWTLKVTDLIGFGGTGTLGAWTLEVLKPAVSVAASDLPKDVPDGGSVESTVVGPITGAQVGKVDVTSFQVWHDLPSDLRARLIAPDGRSVSLFDRPACLFEWAENRYPWGFADDPIFPRSTCPSPYLPETAWQPLGALSALVGAPASGTWRLRIDDSKEWDTGSLRSWTLRLTLLPDTWIDGAPETGAVTLGASESDVRFECAIDGAAFSPCASPWTVPVLAPGRHSLAARAIDVDGGVDPTPATTSWSTPAASTPVTPNAPSRPVAAFTATAAFRLPANRACLKRPARLTLTYRNPAGVTVTRLEAWVGRKRLFVRTGPAARRSLTLRRLPSKRFTLTIKVTPKGGKTVTATRTYKVCSPR